MVLTVKSPPANAGDIRNVGSILGLGRSLGVVMATHSSLLAWRNAQTKEPGRVQSIGLQRVEHD